MIRLLHFFVICIACCRNDYPESILAHNNVMLSHLHSLFCCFKLSKSSGVSRQFKCSGKLSKSLNDHDEFGSKCYFFCVVNCFISWCTQLKFDFELWTKSAFPMRIFFWIFPLLDIFSRFFLNFKFCFCLLF